LLKLSEYNLILTQYEESMKTIDKVLKQDPQNAMGYFLFGMNFKESGDTIRAINSFQKAVELDAELIDAWLNLGQLYEAIGDPLAERYFDNAIRIAPDDVIALHSKADYLSNQNDLEGAIELYRKMISIDPQYEVAYFNSGLIFLDMDSIAQAKNQFDLTLKMSPTHIRAYYYRGLSKEMLGDTEAAISDYKQALKMAPNYEYAQEALNRLGE
jgi:tetratricopeptide (TPR) repeat protein